MEASLQSRTLQTSVRKSAQIKASGSLFSATLLNDFKRDDVLPLFRKIVAIFKSDTNVFLKNEIPSLLKVANDLFPYLQEINGFTDILHHNDPN